MAPAARAAPQRSIRVLGMRPLEAHCHLGLGRLYQRMGDRKSAAAISAARDLFRHGHDLLAA